MQLAHNVGHLVDRAGKLPGVLDKAGKISQLYAAGQVQKRPEYTDHGQGEIVDAVDRGPHNGPVGLRRSIGVHRFAVFFVQRFKNRRLLAVRLRGFLPVHHFLGEAVEFAQRRATAPEEGPHPGGNVPGEQNGQRNGHTENQRQLRCNRQHHNQG